MSKKFGPKELAAKDVATPDSEHPWAETRDRKPDDRLLRSHGFSIASRPREGPNLWVRRGIERIEAVALAMARNAEENAEAAK